MRKLATSMAIVTLLALVTGCAEKAPPPTADEVFGELRAQFSETEDPAQKLEIAKSFLSQFPDSEYAPSVVQAAINILEDDLDDPEQALSLAEETLKAVTNPETRFKMKSNLWRLARARGQAFSLREVVAELGDSRELTYTEIYELMEMAVDSEEWDLVEAWGDAGLEFASTHAYRADYPDRELSDEEASFRAANRRTNCLAHKGWAIYKQGRPEEAISVFASGEADVRYSYVGAPESPLFKYWGRALFEQGELNRAAELLEADAVMGGSKLATNTLREIHIARTGSEDGFDELLQAARTRLARSVDDFRLSTYSGSEFQLASTRGRVVLLNFWFPT